MSNYYVTTPIYYVNDVPHIGTAYPTIAADILARFHRMMGDDVMCATGTDENATKVARVAQARGEQPLEFVEQMAAAFQETWRRMNISYTDFIRTTEPRQQIAVQHLVETLYQRGDIYFSEYEGWYCIPCETHYLEGQLVEGACPECHRPVERLKEPGYFFRLSKYAQPLLDYIEAYPEWLQPEFRKNEALAFIKGGLRDVNITRKSDWGIPVPTSLPESAGLVIYVWFDAVINYITVAGYPTDMERFHEWWPADVAPCGEGYFHPLPRHALAGDADGRWPGAAALGFRTRLLDHWRREDQQIDPRRERVPHQPAGLAEELVESSGATLTWPWTRCAILFSAK